VGWFRQNILRRYTLAIGPEQRSYMMNALKKAIAKYYGDRVPTLEDFRNKKRKTFMEKLEEAVNATEWRTKLAEARAVRGTAQGVVTRLENEHSVRKVELDTKHQQEYAELKAKQQKEIAALAAHYEMPKLDAREALQLREKELSELARASYFAGLGNEDDGKSMYSSPTIDDAIRQRVDKFIELNLTEDEEGIAVLKRMEQEQLVSDSAHIADNMKDLRALVIEFIGDGKLPPVTVEAWRIENGVDLKVQ
jgi:excinuclease UvrABC ATPase subunit